MNACRLASIPTLLALSLILATPARAQTSEDLFDGSVLHDIQLTMKDGDWETLQENYLSDTYYPADMTWREVVVPQVGVRLRQRQPQREEARTQNRFRARYPSIRPLSD